MNKEKPKVRTAEESKALEELASEETRIYKLYKDYAVNDLKRDKKTAIEGIKRIKHESKNWRG
jgi:shikimate kinase